MFKVIYVSFFFFLLGCGSDNGSSEARTAWLFTQSAPSGFITFIEDTKDPSKDYTAKLTLNKNNQILGFTDRPERLVKYIDNSYFSSLWHEDGNDSFRADPPNAVMHFSMDDDAVNYDEPIILVNNVYIETDNLNTTIYDIKPDGTKTIKDIWEMLKGSSNCTEKSMADGPKPRLIKSCSLNNPSVFIDNFWDDFTKGVTTVLKTVTKTVTDPTALCATTITTAFVAASVDDGEEEEFDASIDIAKAIGNAEAKDVAITAACASLGVLIQGFNSKLEVSKFTPPCSRAVSMAVDPFIAAVNIGATLICGGSLD